VVSAVSVECCVVEVGEELGRRRSEIVDEKYPTELLLLLWPVDKLRDYWTAIDECW